MNSLIQVNYDGGDATSVSLPNTGLILYNYDFVHDQMKRIDAMTQPES